MFFTPEFHSCIVGTAMSPALIIIMMNNKFVVFAINARTAITTIIPTISRRRRVLNANQNQNKNQTSSMETVLSGEYYTVFRRHRRRRSIAFTYMMFATTNPYMISWTVSIALPYEYCNGDDMQWPVAASTNRNGVVTSDRYNVGTFTNCLRRPASDLRVLCSYYCSRFYMSWKTFRAHTIRAPMLCCYVREFLI